MFKSSAVCPKEKQVEVETIPAVFECKGERTGGILCNECTMCRAYQRSVEKMLKK